MNDKLIVTECTNKWQDYATVAPDGELPVALVPMTTVEETNARAHRLAASWNACEDINPEAVPELLKDNDLMRKLLRRILAVHPRPPLTPSRDFAQEEAWEAANAIAKAKGE